MTDNDMSDATRKGSSATSQFSDAGRDAYEQVKTKARDTMSRTGEAARTQAMGQAENAKDALASSGERLAESLRSAMDGGDDSVQARLMAAAADAISDMSDSLRGRSFNDLMSDANGFARRNPGAFVAVAALAGFGIARFARASASRSTERTDYTSPYGARTPSSTSYAPGSGYASSSMGNTGTGMGAGSGVGSGGSYTGAGSLGAGTGSAYGAGRSTGGQVSTSGMSTHDDDADDTTSLADSADATRTSTSAGTTSAGTTSGASTSGTTKPGTGGTGYDR